MAVVIEAAAGLDGSGLAGKRNERFLQGLAAGAAHEGEFSTARGIDNLCIDAGAFCSTMRSRASKVRPTASSEVELPSVSQA
jgi:hypothetical protein